MMSPLGETLRKHRARKGRDEDRGGMPTALLRYLKEQYDRTVARSELRSIGEDDPTAVERNPPRCQLRSIEELEGTGERYSAEHKRDHNALYDEIEQMNRRGERMPEEELDQRIEAILDADDRRPAEIPPTVEEMRAYRDSARGGAETRELRMKTFNDGDRSVDLNPSIDPERFDKGYKELREEMLERKAEGRPMSRGEFQQSYERIAMEAGESRGVARKQAGHAEFGRTPPTRDRDRRHGAGAAREQGSGRPHVRAPAPAPPRATSHRTPSSSKREAPAQSR